MIEEYYNLKYRFNDFVRDLKEEKVAGNELTLILIARYLKRNITVLSPFNMWTLYPTLSRDIVIMYDWRFAPTQDLSTSATAQSKSTDFLMNLFLNTGIK